MTPTLIWSFPLKREIQTKPKTLKNLNPFSMTEKKNQKMSRMSIDKHEMMSTTGRTYRTETSDIFWIYGGKSV